MSDNAKKESLLLHLCCAPCAPYPIGKLKEEFNLALYYYNPNIHPKEEYLFRLEEAKKLSREENLPLFVGDYRIKEWFEMTKEFKDEPERGKRCELCISERMRETANKAAVLGIKHFGTTLSVSPHKDALMINRAGKAAENSCGEGETGHGILFYETDFKKKDGFKISSRIGRERGFKRQDYCGCVYSRAEKNRLKRRRLSRHG